MPFKKLIGKQNSSQIETLTHHSILNAAFYSNRLLNMFRTRSPNRDTAVCERN